MEMNPPLDKINGISILTGWRGSIAHSMYIAPEEPQGTDDKDLMAVVIPDLSYYFGLNTFGSRGTQEIMQDPWDIVAYEFKKFVGLLENGNPNVLSLLWLDEAFILQQTEAGHLLRSNRGMFSGKHLYHSFVGYAHGQMQRMTRGQSASGRGFMGEKRKKIREDFGYDTKNAAHLIRILRMGVQFLNTGILQVNRENIDAKELIAIKRGELSLEEVTFLASDLFQAAEKARIDSRLPERPDHDKINRLCISILQGHFK